MNTTPARQLFATLCLCLATEVSHARYAAIVVDASTGNVLEQVDANQAWYPASLTKVMTLYMAFDALRNGRLDMDDFMDVSSHAAQQKPSKLGLRAGESIRVQDAILAVITRSANDAAVVLAEHIGGSEPRFANMMTDMAHSLNMVNSNFINATGLPNDRQISTARDLAVLAWRVQRDFPEYYRLFSAHGFYFNGREYHSTNKFVASYPGAEGMKTGYTCGSGHNLIATAQQNGTRLIGVVLGGMSSVERYNLMYDLMDDNFEDVYNSRGNPFARGHHINTVATGYAGAPPYQLDCGDRPESPFVYRGAPSKDLAEASTYVPKADWHKSTYASSQPYKPSRSTITPVALRPAQQWSVDLGMFHSQYAAESANRKAAQDFSHLLKPALPVVVKSQSFNRESRWHALWSGFGSIYAAGDACKALWQRNIECTVSKPENTPATALRAE
jgi:D-alanyl-D-alanine carboxypeptidase